MSMGLPDSGVPGVTWDEEHEAWKIEVLRKKGKIISRHFPVCEHLKKGRPLDDAINAALLVALDHHHELVAQSILSEEGLSGNAAIFDNAVTGLGWHSSRRRLAVGVFDPASKKRRARPYPEG